MLQPDYRWTFDYNYVAHAERDAMQADRPKIEEALESLVKRLGFRVQKSMDAFAGRKVYAKYYSVLEPESHVEVDLNYLWRVPLAGVETRTLWQPDGLDRPRIRTVSRYSG
jgi:hypothetical protein